MNPTMARLRRIPPAARAALAVVAVLASLWPSAKVQPLSAYDQPFYIGIADDILRHGRFTDGVFAPAGHPSGMRFAPLYPALLAAAAALDPPLGRRFDCVAAGVDCGRGAVPIRTAQFVLLVVAYWLTWDIAVMLGLAEWSWLALALALLTAPLLLSSVDYLMTETVSFALTTAFAAALVRRRRLAAGALLGLAILVRPGFLYLAYAMLAVGLWSVAVPALLAPLPWILRNAVVLGHAQLTFGYAAHTLAQRISFDSMDWHEYGLSFLCWLPDGNGLGRSLAGPGACARFGWDERPDTFYAIGMRQLVPETLRAAGGPEHQLAWLFTHDILRDPFWHLAVSVPLALRGLWIDHYWGLILAPICIWRLIRGDRSFRAAALPALFMLAFNAAFSVNQVRYNLMLIPPFAVAGADASRRIWSAIRARAMAT